MSTKSPDFLPSRDEGAKWQKRLADFATATGHSLTWTEFVTAVGSHAGGEAQTALLVVQGLALGIRTFTWLRQRR